MSVDRLFPRLVPFVCALLLAGIVQNMPVTAAIIGDAITYQGRLTDENGKELNGNFTMRFQIYNAAAGGTLLWDSGNTSIPVINGVFEANLETTTDIFNGEELWLAQTIGGELLSPRQEFLPTPMAHTLRPGAIIKGTANALPNNYLLEVEMNNNAFAFNRGAITGKATTGNAIYGLANNGRAIYGQTQDGYAVYGFDGGNNANRGYAGYFYSTNGIGIYGYSNANRANPNILAPAVYGESNRGVGVYGRGDTSDSYSIYNEGGYFEGGKGLYARGTDPASQQGYGARIFSSSYRGMYVQGAGGNFDAYFGGSGGISTNGIVDRSASQQSLVVNSGDTTIEPGDLVAMVGIAESPEDGQPMLAVAKLNATNRDAVIGVAKEAISVENITTKDAENANNFTPISGNIAQNSYLVIITDGLAPEVNMNSLTLLTGADSNTSAQRTNSALASMKIGTRMAVSADGNIGPANGESPEIKIGKIAGPVNNTRRTVPLFLDID